MSALNAHQRLALRNLKEMATAVRVGTKTDDKGWAKFMRLKG